MKVIIAGSRTITDENIVREALGKAGLSAQDITEVVSGGAKGVDLLGKKIAEYHAIPIKKFPADWDKHGKAAGAIRNSQMAQYADMLVAVWDGESKGTKDMIRKIRNMMKEYYVYFVTKAN